MRTYNNPVIRGFNPDPSVLRVGDDYYCVTSTFQYFPAIPIYHSKDLVNWKRIGHAITESEYLDLSNSADSHGIWAPDISYHGGKYWIFAPFRLNNEDTENGENQTGRLRIQLVMWADRPEGPYSAPQVVEVDDIDPSHFVDEDGTRYMITAPGVTVTQLDATGTKIVKPPVTVWEGTNRAPEGPHILKKDGYYYAILAEGGTGFGHRISIARAKDLYGPYEVCPHNPVLMQTDREALIQKSGHGKLVQTQNGDWWVMYLCARRNIDDHCTLGRETAMDPVVWTDDGWFSVGSGVPSHEQTAPNLPEHKWELPPVRDDFDQNALSLEWMFVRNPKAGNYSLTERPGHLRLKGSLYDLSEVRAYNTVVRRETELSYQAIAKLAYAPDFDGQEAGLVCYSGIHTFIKLCKAQVGGKIVYHVIQSVNGVLTVLGEAEASQGLGDVFFKIDVKAQSRQFLYSHDGDNWTQVAVAADCRFLSTEHNTIGKHHTGTMVGMYHHNPTYRYVNADFDWFEYSV